MHLDLVILAVHTGHGGGSFVGLVDCQRYTYSSSGTFIAVHIQQLRYVNLVNAIGGTFYFRSTAVRRGCPFAVSLSLFLAIPYVGRRMGRSALLSKFRNFETVLPIP